MHYIQLDVKKGEAGEREEEDHLQLLGYRRGRIPDRSTLGAWRLI